MEFPICTLQKPNYKNINIQCSGSFIPVIVGNAFVAISDVQQLIATRIIKVVRKVCRGSCLNEQIFAAAVGVRIGLDAVSNVVYCLILVGAIVGFVIPKTDARRCRIPTRNAPGAREPRRDWNPDGRASTFPMTATHRRTRGPTRH